MKVKDLIDGISGNYINKISELTGLSVDAILNVKIKTKKSFISRISKIAISPVGGESCVIDKNTIILTIDFDKRKIQDLALLCHELTHIEQMRRIGTAKFITSYLKEYISNTKHYSTLEECYKNISYEKDAYDRQKNFIKYCYNCYSGGIQ